MRLLFPDIAKPLPGQGGGHPDDNATDYMMVEPRGSDVTIFCFSGMAMRLGGVPVFEFRKLLEKHGKDYNVVFFRDVHNVAFHLTPDGEPGGRDFYEAKIRELMVSLGAKYNVTMGASGGASAAIYYATRCRMDRAIAFSPAFPLSNWVSPGARWRIYLDFKKLVMHPYDYFEVLLVALAVRILDIDMRERVGIENVWDIVGEYERSPAPRPPVAIVHGKDCRPDGRIAATMAQFPEVELCPLPTGCHGGPAYLKRRGQLAPLVLEQVGKAITMSDDSRRAQPVANRHATIEPS